MGNSICDYGKCYDFKGSLYAAHIVPRSLRGSGKTGFNLSIIEVMLSKVIFKGPIRLWNYSAKDINYITKKIIIQNNLEPTDFYK